MIDIRHDFIERVRAAVEPHGFELLHFEDSELLHLYEEAGKRGFASLAGYLQTTPRLLLGAGGSPLLLGPPA